MVRYSHSAAQYAICLWPWNIICYAHSVRLVRRLQKQISRNTTLTERSSKWGWGKQEIIEPLSLGLDSQEKRQISESHHVTIVCAFVETSQSCPSSCTFNWLLNCASWWRHSARICLVQRTSASVALIQLTGGANSSSRIMPQVLLSPRGYFSWLCLHPPACVLKLTFGGEVGALLSSSWPPLLASTWQHERHVTCRLSCNASNLYTDSLGMKQACWCSEFCVVFFLKAILAQWRWH